MGLNRLQNYGDKFILQNLQYIVEQTGEMSRILDVDSIGMIRKNIYYFILLFSKLFPKATIRYKLEFFAVSFRNRRYYRRILKESDALIFGVGSFKYGTQKLWIYFSIVIEEAQKLGIPIMINGVNIQKYSREDYRCQVLKKHVNYPCVKMISSRDGIKGVNRLKKDYLTSNKINCKDVGDIAFWIPECYHIQKNENTELVGINLIDGNIFERYGYHFKEEELLEYYCNILRILDNHKIAWKLFTNGLPVDNKFGMKVIKQYGSSKDTLHIPHSEKELLEIIKDCKVVMGARLHACICAYALDIPVIGFIWDEKLISFTELVGIREYFYDENQINADIISNQLIHLLDKPYTYDTKRRYELKMKAKKAINFFIENEI